MRRIKFLSKKKKRKIRRSLNLLKRRKRFFSSNTKLQKGRIRDNSLKRRSAIKNMKHTFRFFYGLTFRKKSLRKLINLKKRQAITVLETRIDTLLYRANFFQTIAESRRFLKHFRILSRKRKSFIRLKQQIKPNTQIAPFQIILLTPSLALKRKMTLLSYIMAGNKLTNCRSGHLLINFKLLAVILLKIPMATEIRYPFANVPLTKFIGVAKYL